MIVWDDQKLDNYAYQTDFSHRINHISKKNWYLFNIPLGIVLGIIMAVLMFVITDVVLSDPARMVLAIALGGGVTKYLEVKAERTTKIAQMAMSVTFAIGIVIYVLSLALK